MGDSISRTDAQPLVPEEIVDPLIQRVEAQSVVLNRFQRFNVLTDQQRIPVLSQLPVAYFVDGDTGVKSTTKAAWANRYINIEEIAVILPVAESVLEDAGNLQLWERVMPKIAEAFAVKLDAAAVLGTDKPTSWPDAIIDGLTAAGNTRSIGTSTDAEGGVMGDHSEMLGKMEDDGYYPDGGVVAPRSRRLFRQARATDGQRLNGEVALTADTVIADGVEYASKALPGEWSAAAGEAALIAFDSREFVVGVRKELTYKLLDQASVHASNGELIYNFATQDMVGLRCVMRCGWTVSNAVNRDQPTEASRYPAAALLNA